MTVQVRKSYGDDGYTTWTVYASDVSGRAGYVRARVTTPAEQRWEFGNPSTFDWAGRYDKRRDAVNALLTYVGSEERMPVYARPNRGKGSPREGTPTDVFCACGHSYRFDVKRPSAVAWLKTKPCPPCRRAGAPDAPTPDSDNATPDNAPEDDATPEDAPTPEDVPDEDAIRALLDSWPKIVPEVQHGALVDLTLLLSQRLAVWLQGPPGTGKSTMAEQAARALGLGFYPVSCHELMTEASLFGYRDANGTSHRTPLRNAYENGGVCLLDEVDNGNPNLLAALNSAMSNGHCVFAGEVISRHADFRVVATANTAGLGPESGYVGRNGVDLATRDRFVTVAVPIDHTVELALAAYGLNDTAAIERATADSIATATGAQRARAITAASNTVTAAEVVATVETVRVAVAARFERCVVSPRTSQHAAAMLRVGFTVREAITSKLVGFTPDDAASVIPSDGAA